MKNHKPLSLCPTNFQAFPMEGLLTRKPQGAIGIIGCTQANWYHFLTVMQNIPEWADKGYALSYGLPERTVDNLLSALPIGYCPSFLQQKDLQHSVSGDLVWDDIKETNNMFSAIDYAAGHYKVMRMAVACGMKVVGVDFDPSRHVDFSSKECEEYIKDAGKISAASARIQAEGVAHLAGDKANIVHYTTSTELFSGSMDDSSGQCTQKSVQEHLREKGYDTHTVGLANAKTDILSLLEKAENLFVKNGAYMSAVLEKDLNALEDEAVTVIDMKNYSDYAGRLLPDEYVVYSKTGCVWMWENLRTENDRLLYNPSEMQGQADVMNAIWCAHVVPHQRAKRAARKNEAGRSGPVFL